eukprot:jgi/Ulvmu1/6949/UM033_0006.1
MLDSHSTIMPIQPDSGAMRRIAHISVYAAHLVVLRLSPLKYRDHLAGHVIRQFHLYSFRFQLRGLHRAHRRESPQQWLHHQLQHHQLRKKKALPAVQFA